MKKILFIITTVCLLCISCNPKKESSKININTEKIDFGSFEIIKNTFPESIIKNKKYIPLDNSNDDILFSEIDKIKIADSSIYILDEKLRKLIVFDSSGVGKGKVGRMGQGPEEYIRITDFDVNNAGDIYFIDGTSDKLFVFDKNLHFVSVQKMHFEADIIHCLPNNKLLFGLSSWNKGENENKKIAITNVKLETEESFLQYDEYKDDNYWISNYFFIDVENSILYNKPIDNFVYQFSETGALEKAYYFDFGKKNVPDEDKKDIDGNSEKYKYYCCLKNFTIINNEYILGTLRDELKTKTFIIDRKNKKLYISKEIAAGDISNISGFFNNQLISFLYPGKDNVLSMDLPDNIKKHIEGENFVICLYELR